MKSRLYLTLGLSILLQLPAPALATTVYFLPGDAYFRTTISEAYLEGITKGRPVTFGYQPTTAYFCGFAGTAKLEIADEEGKLLEQMQQAYAVIRRRFPKQGILDQKDKTIALEDGGFRLEKEGEPQFIETNPLHVLIYNAEFDFENHRLLHLYNENWRKESFGVHEEPNELIGDKAVIVESLEHAEEVPPLNVTRKGSPSEEAHLVPGGELQIIIVPVEEWLAPIAHMRKKTGNLEVPTPEELQAQPGLYSSPEIYLIKSDGLYVRKLDKGKWSEAQKVTYEELTKPGPGFF